MTGDPIRSVGVYYFSGTGNTELLAERFVAEFAQRGVQADLARIETFTRAGSVPDTTRYDLLGIGYTIHAWNAPRLVFEFLSKLPDGAGQRVFTFKCPGDPLVNGGSTLPVRHTLERKGYRVVHESMMVMPANLAIQYPLDLKKELYAVACRRIARSVGEMLAGTERLQRNSLLMRLATSVSWVEQRSTCRLGRHFYLREACHGCGLCAARCPAGNIQMVNERPTFGRSCLACLRCVYLCPVQAIGIHGLDWVLLKEGYDIRVALADPRSGNGFLLPRLKGYYRRFLAYVAETPE